MFLKSSIKFNNIDHFKSYNNEKLDNGDWGLGIGDWGLANPQSPILK